MIRILKNLRQNGKEFVTAEELKDYGKQLYFNYRNLIKYLISHNYILKIFDDLFYVKTFDEIEKKRLRYSILEIMAKSLEAKGIKCWYYGIYTALTLLKLNSDHQDKFIYLINNKILKNKPIIILDHQFRFLRLKDIFFNFGIIKKEIKYSDLEKTVLDFIYLWKYNRIHKQKIIINISKFLNRISEEKILEYSQNYPKSNRRILREALNQSNITISK